MGLALLDAREHAPLRVGVVGLGAGTLAAYGRAGDVFRFYDINSDVVGLARSEFTFLKDSPAKGEVALGDARLSLERELPEKFDVLALAAFSSDAIPVHLLPVENDDDDDAGVYRSDWMLLSASPAAFEGKLLKEAAERIDAVPRVKLWTDDYSDLYRILK